MSKYTINYNNYLNINKNHVINFICNLFGEYILNNNNNHMILVY